jgi:hypothetical protein
MTKEVSLMDFLSNKNQEAALKRLKLIVGEHPHIYAKQLEIPGITLKDIMPIHIDSQECLAVTRNWIKDHPHLQSSRRPLDDYPVKTNLQKMSKRPLSGQALHYLREVVSAFSPDDRTSHKLHLFLGFIVLAQLAVIHEADPDLRSKKRARWALRDHVLDYGIWLLQEFDQTEIIAQVLVHNQHNSNS